MPWPSCFKYFHRCNFLITYISLYIKDWFNLRPMIVVCICNRNIACESDLIPQNSPHKGTSLAATMGSTERMMLKSHENPWSPEFYFSKHQDVHAFYIIPWQWNATGYLYFVLTHWGRVTHICISNLTIIGSNNGLFPDRCQAIFCCYLDPWKQTSVKF